MHQHRGQLVNPGQGGYQCSFNVGKKLNGLVVSMMGIRKTHFISLFFRNCCSNPGGTAAPSFRTPPVVFDFYARTDATWEKYYTDKPLL